MVQWSLVEHAIGGVKRFGIVSQIFRNKKKGFDDTAMLISSGLWNYHLAMSLLFQSSEGHFFKNLMKPPRSKLWGIARLNDNRSIVNMKKSRKVRAGRHQSNTSQDRSRPLVVLAWVSLAIAIVALTLPYKMAERDVWIHVATGEWILSHGSVPSTDPFSFTASDHPYVAHEWLAQVLFALIYAGTGVVGLSVFKFGVASATYAFTLQTARRLGAQLSVILPAFAVLIYCVTTRIVERPQILSSLLLATYLWLFVRFRNTRNPRWLFAIPLLQMLWVNLHGGHLMGLFFVAVIALGETAMWVRARYLMIGEEKALSLRELAFLTALVPACIIAAFLTPYGSRLLWFPIEQSRLQWVLETNSEWQAPYAGFWPPFSWGYHSPWFVAYLIHVIGLFAAFFAAYRDHVYSRIRAGANRVLLALLVLVALGFIVSCLASPYATWVSPTLGVLLYVCFGLFVAFICVNIRTVDLAQAGVIIGFFFLSVRYVRAVPDFALVTFPILAATASTWINERARHRNRLRGITSDSSSHVALAVGVTLLVLLAEGTLYFTYYDNFSGAGREKGFGLGQNSSVLPVCATNFLAEHAVTGKAFTDVNSSAFVAFRMYPHLKINMDIRDSVYGEQLFREYGAALGSLAAMQQYIARYGINVIVLGLQHYKLMDALLSTGAWVPVHYDDATAILVPRRSDMDVLITHEAYTVIKPWTVAAVTDTNAGQVLAESTRALQNCPRATFAYAWQARALVRLHREAEAREVEKKIPQELRIGWSE